MGSILALGALLTTFVAQDHYSIYVLDFTSASIGLVLLSTLLLYISETNEHSVCGYFIGKVYL